MGFHTSRRSTSQYPTVSDRQAATQQQALHREQSTGEIWTTDIDRGEQHFGLAIPDTRILQRLQLHESTFGAEVHDWIAEGMPTEIMGKPRDMEAFRQRQAARPPAVPTNIERENKRSVLRSQKAASAPSRAGEAGVPASVREVISSTGRSLDASVQRAMEDRMSESLGDVRIHTGPQAATACESINARAFTVGNHIAFNSGEYDPSSPEGQHVLAHELAHVRQQTGGAVSMLPQENVELAVDPDPALERDAEQTAQRVMRGGDLGVQRLGTTAVHVQRSVVGSPQMGYLSGGGSNGGGDDSPGLLEKVADWMRGDDYDPNKGGVESLDADSLSETLQTVVDDVADLKQTVYGDDGIDTEKIAAKGIAPALAAGGAGVVASASLPATLLGAGGALFAGSAKELYGQSIERTVKEGSPFQQELDALKSKFDALADAVGLGHLTEAMTGEESNKTDF